MSDKVYVYCHEDKKVVAVCCNLDIASAVSDALDSNHYTVGTAEYFKGAYPDLVLEPEKAIIMIVSGCASIVEKPNDLVVEIHDYDIEGEWDEDNVSCKTDIEGDRYQVLFFPATKIKFSANGDNAFTDVEIKYLNYYRCPLCEEEWEDKWDCMVDDECPNCKCRNIPPYKSDDLNEVEEDANFHIEILQHDISYYFEDGSKMDVLDCEWEHIHYTICEGCCEGDLSKVDTHDEEKTVRGYWKIVK